MSNAINWDLLSKLCRGRSLAEVQTELESFYALKASDEEKAAELVKALFQNASKLSHLRKPDVIGAVVRRMAGDSMDPALIDALNDRVESVLARDYKIEAKRLGVKNPFFVEPAPDSRAMATNGNVR